MCLRPRFIRNRAHTLSKNGGKLWVCIPCGECSECRKQRSDEYIARANAEYEYTKKQGGFVYFDTFTYNEENVPTFHGLRCFDSRDYKDFMKRLRRNLDYAGYVAKGNLKYLWVSEYGGKTHRPHYHALFYVTIPNMTPMKFRYFIKKSWRKGFIDRANTVEKRVVDGVGAIAYVAKYVNKDDDYTKKLRSMRDNYYEKWNKARLEKSDLAETYFKYYEMYSDKANDGTRSLFPYHRQSEGFGISLMDEADKIMETGMVTIPDKKKIRRHVKCPMYILRKLFYESVKDEYCSTNDKGKLNARWKITEKGKEWKEARLNKSIDLIVKRCVNIAENLDNYKVKIHIFNEEVELPLEDKQAKLLRLLDGRSFEDYAVYKLVYQGKLYNKWYYMRTVHGTHKEVPDMYDFYYRTLADISEVEGREQISNVDGDIWTALENYDRKDFRLLISDIDGYMRDGEIWNLNRYCINQETFEEFRYFDDLDCFFRMLTEEYDNEKQSAYDRKQEMKSKMKLCDERY